KKEEVEEVIEPFSTSNALTEGVINKTESNTVSTKTHFTIDGVFIFRYISALIVKPSYVYLSSKSILRILF
ncbi:MAG: hypothetical protein KAS95_04145, partial [Candidatus Heimdallarchaeota archaeon]|nr:hypothetical protein [Candidatus Heimdallarchaeota archaeon]